MNTHKIRLLVVLMLTGLGANAQIVSLKEAIDFSLKNHGSNVVYNNELKISSEQSKEALSAYLPQVNATFTLDDNLKRQTTVLPGLMFGRAEDIQVQLGNKYNTNALIQLDQTIYDQALIYGIKAGIPAKKIAELNREKNNEELIYNTVSAYSQVLLLKEQQKLVQANEKQYQELYSISKFRFDKGVAKKLDLDRVTVQLNNIRSQQKQIQTSIDVAYTALKNAMGMPLNASVQIEDTLDYNKYLSLYNDSLSVENLVAFKLQEQNIALQQIDVKRKQAAYLPTISGYARNGQQAFGNELNTALSDWRNYAAVGLKVSIPIFGGQRRSAQLAQSKLKLENAKQNLQLSSNQFEMQFQNAGQQLQENITNLSLNKNNMDLAKTVYETSQFEYSKGVSTMADLLNADFSYQQAQSNYMSSLLNLVTNRLIYERAKGNITGFIQQL